MKQTVIDTLKDNHTQSINFNLTGSTGLNLGVSSADLSKVATFIEQDKISVVEGNVPAGMAKYTSADDGADKANTMYVGANNTSESVFKSLLVHEAVHAVFDINKTTLPWLDNEVIAYIAQGFYVKSAGHSSGLSQQAFLGLEIANAFGNIANDPFWLDELKGSLLSSPTYHGYIRGEFKGDG